MRRLVLTRLLLTSALLASAVAAGCQSDYDASGRYIGGRGAYDPGAGTSITRQWRAEHGGGGVGNR